MKGIEFLISLKERVTKPLQSINRSLDKTRALAGKLRNIVINPKISSESLHMIDKMNNGLGSLKGLVLGGALAAGFMAVGSSAIDALAKTEKFETILTKTLGNKDLAAGTLQALNDMGDKTNFQSEELIDHYIKLANRGLRPLEGEMMAIGDVANVLGKDFGQVNEAILDISNSERWKEIGIQSEKVGNKLNLTFKGVTQTVDATEAGALSAITAFGQMNGVMGVTAEIGQTTGGKISTLKDSLARVYTTIGKELQPEINGLIDTLSGLVVSVKDAVLWISTNRDVIKEVALVIGIAAGAWGAYLLVVNAVTYAQAALTWVMLQNPIGLIIVGIAALVAAIVILWEKSEKFRGVLLGLWEAAKTVFSNIWEAGKKYLGGLGQLISGILTMDPTTIKEGLKNAFGGAMDLATGAGKGVGASFNKGFEDGVNQVRWKEGERQDAAFAKKNGTAGAFTSEGASTLTAQGDKKKKSKAESRLNSVVGEASNQRNITINIGTMKGAETINVKADNVKDFMNASRFTNMLEEALLRAVRNTEQAI